MIRVIAQTKNSVMFSDGWGYRIIKGLHDDWFAQVLKTNDPRRPPVSGPQPTRSAAIDWARDFISVRRKWEGSWRSEEHIW